MYPKASFDGECSPLFWNEETIYLTTHRACGKAARRKSWSFFRLLTSVPRIGAFPIISIPLPYLSRKCGRIREYVVWGTMFACRRNVPKCHTRSWNHILQLFYEIGPCTLLSLRIRRRRRTSGKEERKANHSHRLGVWCREANCEKYGRRAECFHSGSKFFS